MSGGGIRRASGTILGGSALFAFGIGLAWSLLFSAINAQTSLTFTAGEVVHADEEPQTADVAEEEAAVQYVNWLNGDLEESAAAAKPHPISVMIENLPTVRPQAGLQQAKVVYETLAEGGATRFLAVFDGSETLTRIGPVRSVRHYYLEWASEYDPAIVHAGGSPKGLEYLSGFGMKDLDCIRNAARYCFRDKGLSAPHNLFTSSELLSFAMRDKEWTDPTDFTAWPYKDQKPLEERPREARAPTVHFSSFSYDSAYSYNREDNCYARVNGGLPHTDILTGDQICVKNVIVQFVPRETYLPAKGRIDLNVTGEGRALIFRDGDTIEQVTWKKASRTGRTMFFNEDDEQIDLVRGSTWVHIVPGDRSVEY